MKYRAPIVDHQPEQDDEADRSALLLLGLSLLGGVGAADLRAARVARSATTRLEWLAARLADELNGHISPEYF